MTEKLYTIPVNEAFDACAEDHSRGCPFCRLYNMLESNELDTILGAAMMEPDIRIKTNAQGFCPTHFDMMFVRKNRLGLALMLESHLDEIRNDMEKNGIAAIFSSVGSVAPVRLNKLDSSCYICGRIEYSFSRMLKNAALLWDEESEFREKITKQPYFCLPHFRMWLESAKNELSKKRYPAFYDSISEVTYRYFDELRGDVSHFCKKFDYRYEDEPWGNSKDAVERAIKFLSADLHKENK